MTQDHGDQTGRGGRLYCWSFANAEFDEARWQLRVAGQDVELEHKPLEVLQHLLRHAGEAVTKDELLSAVWAGRVVVEAVLTNAIGKLRRALADEAQDIIVTLPRVGYRLAVPVSRRAVEFLPDASRLDVGDAVPRRANWRLETALARTEGNEVWLARHAKTHEARVFKFSLAGKGVSGLKREVTVARLLRESLGEREDFVRALDWDFEQAPYFIESEYGGASMDRWPSNGELASVAVEQRLALFAQAAEAVAAAHSVGVLHKDLKPANLLIEGDGADARLRVADFGSSRLFDSGVLDELDITRLGLTQTQVLSSDSGTPLYLAPELVAGQSATIKSDVYALGVTLYQLLVGDFRRPLAPGWESDIDDVLLRQDIADAANGDPAKRLESAAALATRIRSIAARREKRALEDAVQARILEGEKRLAKARARRPWMIAAGLLLVAGLGATGWQLKRSVAAEHVAAEQRDRAQKQAARAEAVVKFLSNDLLRALAPGGKAFEKEPTIKSMLELASSDLGDKFKEDPATLGSLHAAIGASWAAFDNRDRSSEHFLKAWKSYERAFGEADEQTLLTLYDYAEEKIMSQKYGEAEKLIEKADKLAGKRLQEDGKLALWSARRRSNLHIQQQEIAEAEPLLKRGIELLPKVLPDMPREEGIFRMRLADVYRRQDKPAEAEALMRQALADPRFIPERVGNDLLNAMQGTLVHALRFQEKYAEALELAKKVATAQETLSGVDSRPAIIARESLAKIHTAAGDCMQSLEIRRLNWSLGVAKYGLAERSNLVNGANLAINEEKCGDRSKAPALLQQVLIEVRKHFGVDDPFNHSFSYHHARMLIDAGRYEEAKPVLDGVSVEKFIAAAGYEGQDHWMDAQRARILIGQGDKKQGRALLAQALDALEKRDVVVSAEQIAEYRKLLIE